MSKPAITTPNPKDVQKFETDLIDQVRAFPCLYDRLDPKFQDASLKNQMWKVVASKCDNSVTQCKKKFQQLLGKFMKLHEDVIAEAITPQMAMKRFPHYNSMLYAKSFLQFKMNDDNGPRNFGQQNNPNAMRFGQNARPNSQMNSMPSLLGIRGPSLNQPFMMNNMNNNNNNRYPSCGPMGGPGGMMNMPSPPMGNNQYSRSSQPNMNDLRSQFMQMNQTPPRNQPRSDDFGDDKDNSHIDFFFRSISQQVKRANLSGEDFLDLQGTILNILALKLPTYNPYNN